MQVGCPSCGHVLTVPAEKAAVPNLKARCRCGTVFAVAAAAAAAVARRSTVAVPGRRCQNHPQLRSEHVCPKCVKGFCNDCVQRVQTAIVCSCEGFCVSAAAYEELQGREKQRDRSMV